MLTLIEKILFVVLAATAVYLAYRPFMQMARIIGRGSGPDKLRFDHLVERGAETVVALFTQGGILRKGRVISSLFHYGIALAFIFYLIVNGLDTFEGYLPEQYHFWTGDNGFWGSYRLIADLLTVAGITGMVYFLLRRFVAADPALTARDNVKLHPKARGGAIRRDSLIVGIFMITHLGARLMGQASLVAAHGADRWQPAASALGAGLSGIGVQGDGAMIAWHASWWLALGSILLFLPYFPRTKHAHLFMGPLNFGTRPDRGSLGAMNSLDFDVDDEDARFGVTYLTDLSQTQILDAFACIMCNRCQEVCPAYTTGKELSPAALEINKRLHIKTNMIDLASGAADDRPLLDYAISESALWACTSCGACSQICPVGNEPMMDILDMRRAQVLMEDQYPHELATAFQGLERRGNPWGATDSRMAWAEGLPFAVPTVTENPDFDYLFWVGCAGAFDPHAQRVARAVVTILDAAGVSFAILGDEETCTGDPARRAGNEYLFQEMAQANIETLNRYKVNERRIVTSCPHCMTTIGTEYRALGGFFQVFHHTQLIADLVGQGKLRLQDNTLEHVTFHDPCYLGRHNGVYDDPRQALADAGLTLLEMDRHGDNSFCCGAGGAQFWKEEEHGAEAVNINRHAEAQATGAETLAVGCPFCSVMLRDANEQAGTPLEVKDVAQIVAERIAS